MRKIAALAAALLVLAPPASSSGGALGRTFGVGIRAGTVRSMGGGWTAEKRMSEAVNAGPDVDVAFEKWIGDHFKNELDLKLAWMSFRDGSFPGAADDPSFTIPALVFSNSYFFGANRLRPFLSAGAGIYFWKINTGGPLRRVYRSEGERLEKMSYGLHGGAGAECMLSKRASLNLEARYHAILSQDRFIFGNEFTEQGVLTAAAGVSVYFTTP